MSRATLAFDFSCAGALASRRLFGGGSWAARWRLGVGLAISCPQSSRVLPANRPLPYSKLLPHINRIKVKSGPTRHRDGIDPPPYRQPAKGVEGLASQGIAIGQTCPIHGDGYKQPLTPCLLTI